MHPGSVLDLSLALISLFGLSKSVRRNSSIRRKEMYASEKRVTPWGDRMMQVIFKNSYTLSKAKTYCDVGNCPVSTSARTQKYVDALV